MIDRVIQQFEEINTVLKGNNPELSLLDLVSDFQESLDDLKEEFIEIRDEANLLECLRNAGVDNWEGWDFAMDEYHELYSEED